MANQFLPENERFVSTEPLEDLLRRGRNWSVIYATLLGTFAVNFPESPPLGYTTSAVIIGASVLERVRSKLETNRVGVESSDALNNVYYLFPEHNPSPSTED